VKTTKKDLKEAVEDREQNRKDFVKTSKELEDALKAIKECQRLIRGLRNGGGSFI